MIALPVSFGRRVAIPGALITLLVIAWTVSICGVPALLPSSPISLSRATPYTSTPEVIDPKTSARQITFEQIFDVEKAKYDYPALRELCAHTEWQKDPMYLQCEGIFAGMATIISEIKVCFKMALDAGTGLILPQMYQRDPNDLVELNYGNPNSSIPYDEWFDADHLIKTLGKACPKMKIVHAKDVGTRRLPVASTFELDLGAVGWALGQPVFWPGKPLRPFYDDQVQSKMFGTFSAAVAAGEEIPNKGIYIVKTPSPFLIYRVTGDPTGHDLRVWTEVTRVIRFRKTPRQIVKTLYSKIPKPYYGVHFRAENDNVWSSVDHQIAVDLDALDKAWEKFGTKDTRRPRIYLACGDRDQVTKFAMKAKERGWGVSHKWQLAEALKDNTTLKLIQGLPFDEQGSVDFGMMLQSDFFIGITGSAFSVSLAHARDPTGRYRGSSFTT